MQLCVFDSTASKIASSQKIGEVQGIIVIFLWIVFKPASLIIRDDSKFFKPSIRLFYAKLNVQFRIPKSNDPLPMVRTIEHSQDFFT